MVWRALILLHDCYKICDNLLHCPKNRGFESGLEVAVYNNFAAFLL
jgi:hypothetical protein